MDSRTLPANLHICLADYNCEVLELATIPNVLLTVHFNPFLATVKSQDDTARDLHLDISTFVLENFREVLRARSISLATVSGSWSMKLTSLIPSLHAADRILILASETIYSPSSISNFTETMLAVLRSGTNRGGSNRKENCALIAVKKVYFGVGGGVDMFRGTLERLGGKSEVVWETGEGVGVGRVILKVTVAV